MKEVVKKIKDKRRRDNRFVGFGLFVCNTVTFFIRKLFTNNKGEIILFVKLIVLMTNR